VDGGYGGEDKDRVKKTLGWSVELVVRARKPAPEEVLMAWARECAKEGMKVDREKLLPPEGFRVLPLSMGSSTDVSLDRPEQEDEQRLREVVRERRSVLVYAAMSRLMVRRLTRL
jgi:hypothetical protein